MTSCKKKVLLFLAAFCLTIGAQAQQIDWVTQIKNKPTLDARTYGVKCDGLTDDRTTLQAALDAAIANGDVLQLPPGTCLFSGDPGLAVTNGKGFNLQGAGTSNTGATVLKYTGSGTAFRIASSVSNALTFGVDISNLVFDTTGTASVLFDLDRLSASFFTNIGVNTDNVGHFNTIFDVRSSNLTRFDNCVITNGTIGYRFRASTTSYDTQDIWINGGQLYQINSPFQFENSSNDIRISNIWVERFDQVIQADNTGITQSAGYPAVNTSGIQITHSTFLSNNGGTSFSASPRIFRGVSVGGKYWVFRQFIFEDNNVYYTDGGTDYAFEIDAQPFSSGQYQASFHINRNRFNFLKTAILTSDDTAVYAEVTGNIDQTPAAPARTVDVAGNGRYVQWNQDLNSLCIGSNNLTCGSTTHTVNIKESRTGFNTVLAVQKNANQINANEPIRIYNSAGSQILGINSDDNSNIFMGYGTGTANNPTNGKSNVFIGQYSGNANSSGRQSTGVGAQSLLAATIGNENTAVGFNAGGLQTQGSSNTYVGTYSGITNSSGNANLTGSYNTWIGSLTGPGVASQLSYATSLGYDAKNDKSNQVALGGATVTEIMIANTHRLIYGTGSPNSAVTGNIGDIYINTSGGAGTTFYIKESGLATNTGWVGK